MALNMTYSTHNLPDNLKNFALHLFENTAFYSIALANGTENIKSTRVEWSEKFKSDFTHKNNLEGQKRPDGKVYVGGDNFFNYTEIFHESVDFSSSKLAVTNGKEIQALAITEAYEEIKLQINDVFLNGVHNFGGTPTEARKGQGIIPSILSNIVDAGTKDGSGEVQKGVLTKKMLNTAFRKILKKTKRKLRNHVIFANAPMVERISSLYGVQPASRTEGGFAITTIHTDYGPIDIIMDITLPEDTILISKIDKLKVCILPTFGEQIYESEIQRDGLAEYSEIATEQMLKYGHEGWHAKIINLKEAEEF